MSTVTIPERTFHVKSTEESLGRAVLNRISPKFFKFVGRIARRLGAEKKFQFPEVEVTERKRPVLVGTLLAGTTKSAFLVEESNPGHGRRDTSKKHEESKDEAVQIWSQSDGYKTRSVLVPTQSRSVKT